MKGTKIFMICCWLFFLAGMLVAVYLSQGLSNYFTGNQYLTISILIYIPLFVITILALIKVVKGKAE